MARLKFTLKAWPVITLVTIGLCYLTQLVAGWFGVDLKEQSTVQMMRYMGAETWRILTQQGLVAAFSQEVSAKFLINIPLVIVVLPLAEEALFRGLLFWLPTAKAPLFGDATRRALVIAPVSSVLFAAAHYLQAPWPDNAFVALFVFGLAQCWLCRKTKSLVCPSVNHALFNLTNLVLLFVIPEAA